MKKKIKNKETKTVLQYSFYTKDAWVSLLLTKLNELLSILKEMNLNLNYGYTKDGDLLVHFTPEKKGGYIKNFNSEEGLSE